MSSGFYKRRRGILEHIESGTIDLLESGIHDYLSLKANLLIGSPCSIPIGVCFTSAPAIYAHCRRVSERTILRCLEHMEEIGWLKTWKIPGKRGNYPVLVCRASVHDLSGNEYRINGAKTTDWRQPVYEPVGEVSPSACPAVGKLSAYREKRLEEQEERKKPAAKPAQRLDPRYQEFVDFAFQSYVAKHEQKPNWNSKDFKNLTALVKKNRTLTTDELKRRWEHYSNSTEPFTVKQGDSLAYFCSKFDSFIDGPIPGTTGGKPDANSIEARNRAAAGFPVN